MLHIFSFYYELVDNTDNGRIRHLFLFINKFTMLITKLHKMRTLLDKHHPLNIAVMKNIQADLMLKYNQQSNAIEGNTLDIFETRVLLESGITANGKPFKDHLDIINHQEAIGYLTDLVKGNVPLTEATIKNFHYL